MTTPDRLDKVAPGLPPEAELVLLSAATCVAPERAARIDALLRGPIDWQLSTRLALSHGVLPLLYRHLHSSRADLVPAPILESLKRHHSGNSLRARYLSGELCRLVALFRSRGIDAIAYKGPTLAWLAYGDIALRQFTDLDILVKEADFPAAAAILRHYGYRSWWHCDALAGNFFQANKDVFSHPDGLRQVDLHWRITPRYFSFVPEADLLFSRCRPVELPDADVPTLAPHDLMLALCAHASRHGWTTLAMVCDVAELLRSHPEVDWLKTLDEARRLGNCRMVLLGLHLARQLAGAELHPELCAAIASDAAVVSLGVRITRRMFSQTQVLSAFQPWLVPLRTIERTGDRVRYCLIRGLAPTAGDASLVSLPRALLPLHYVLRPLRLAFQQGRHLISGASAG